MHTRVQISEIVAAPRVSKSMLVGRIFARSSFSRSLARISTRNLHTERKRWVAQTPIQGPKSVHLRAFHARSQTPQVCDETSGCGKRNLALTPKLYPSKRCFNLVQIDEDGEETSLAVPVPELLKSSGLHARDLIALGLQYDATSRSSSKKSVIDSSPFVPSPVILPRTGMRGPLSAVPHHSGAPGHSVTTFMCMFVT